MENLLKNYYTKYYNLPVCNENDLSLFTNAQYFELEDDRSGNVKLYEYENNGTAIYVNQNKRNFAIINYDKFVTSLPANFQNKRKRCDLIIYTDLENRYFLLNELKDANIESGRKQAKKQLMQSLFDILEVSEINNFVKGFSIKRCCIFNKRPINNLPIDAPKTFNRLSTIVSNGIKLNNKDFEAKGFELWEFFGGAKFIVN